MRPDPMIDWRKVRGYFDGSMGEKRTKELMHACFSCFIVNRRLVARQSEVENMAKHIGLQIEQGRTVQINRADGTAILTIQPVGIKAKAV